ncbi:unnamed protein product [Meloidogyne enterolobii]|uniref:Uncharacterized protein n=1 Tax=Meloidogyne enterolobii TaxID=390850 RepID=A0ACB0YWM2_MELEN
MPILSSSSNTRKYSEQSLANFNRAQFFFNPSHIQPQTDRRCLQRLHIENSFAKLNSFVIFSCGEEKLPAVFKEFYDELIYFEIDPAHSYQLVINSLTYFYSKITWATSVQKCVFEFICEFLGEFHSHLDKKHLIELELVCLLELFMIRYEYKNGNGNNIFNILVQIRKTSKGADCHLSGFVNNFLRRPLVSPMRFDLTFIFVFISLFHLFPFLLLIFFIFKIFSFGYTLEPLLRNICDRLNLQVKLYRSSDSLQNISTKRKSSMTSSNQESHTSSIEPNNSFSEDEELNEEEGNSEDEISKSIEKKRSKSHDKINKLASKKLKTTDKLKIRKKASRGRRRY